MIGELAGEREFPFDLERAVFLTVLHRLFDPGSDRAAEKWRHGLVINDVGDLERHQLYRAMGWLGDELADQSGRGLAPRTTKGPRRGAAVRHESGRRSPASSSSGPDTAMSAVAVSGRLVVTDGGSDR